MQQICQSEKSHYISRLVVRSRSKGTICPYATGQIVGDRSDPLLRTELLWSNDDPLFPPSKIAVGESGHFENCGLDRKHWKSAAAIREIFRGAFALADLPYYNPHSFRKTLVSFGYKRCAGDLEAFKVWSQNLGHTQMLTTLSSYGTVPPERQAEILSALRIDEANLAAAHDDPQADTVQSALAHLVKAIRKTD